MTPGTKSDSNNLVRQTRYRAKLAGSYDFARCTVPTRPDLQVRTDTTILLRRTGYRTEMAGSHGSSRYTVPMLPNLAPDKF